MEFRWVALIAARAGGKHRAGPAGLRSDEDRNGFELNPLGGDFAERNPRASGSFQNPDSYAEVFLFQKGTASLVCRAARFVFRGHLHTLSPRSIPQNEQAGTS